MLDIIVVSLIVVVLSYGLFKQTQKTIGLSKNENQSKKRALIGNYLTTIFYGVFIIAYILNVFTPESLVASSELILQICFLSVIATLVSKFVITPKENAY